HQASIHLPTGQVGPFDIRRMPAHQIQHLGWITVDDLDMYTRDPIAASLFDNLDILPVQLRLFATGWPPTPLIGRNLPPGLDQRRAIIAFAIGRHSRWMVRMPALLELGHQVVCNLFLGLANRTTDAQTRIHIQGYAAPEGAALVGKGIAPFSPLLPT